MQPLRNSNLAGFTAGIALGFAAPIVLNILSFYPLYGELVQSLESYCPDAADARECRKGERILERTAGAVNDITLICDNGQFLEESE